MLFALLFSLTCAPTNDAAQQLTALEAQLMAADYRGDLDALSRLKEQTARFNDDRELGYLARYWSGFASWRIAIDGANHDMKPELLAEHLKNAATDFYLSLEHRRDFADAYAAAAGANGWLIAFLMNGPKPDVAGAKERLALFRTLMARATELEPENPRVLWIQASPLMFQPPERGGDIAAAIALYRSMLRSAERSKDARPSPLPDWGRPEALMSLAYAHSVQTPPDLTAAMREARAALELQPEWSYVRDILLPQIQKKVGTR